MRTVEEILKDAGQLSPLELAKLRQGLDRWNRPANSLEIRSKAGTKFRLARIEDSEVVAIMRQSIAIYEDLEFYLLWQRVHQVEFELDFARVYLTLKYLFGESCDLLDDLKFGFIFPFFVYVEKKDQTFQYILEICSIRGALYYNFRRVVEPGDERLKNSRSYPIIEEEFGITEMRGIRCYLHSFLVGRWETLDRAILKPCVRRIRIDYMLFGYVGGETFEKRYSSETEFKLAWDQYQKQVARELAENDGNQ